MESILLALIPGLVKLIESALSDNYDQEAEMQALLQMQRAAADERMKRLIADRT